jgi:drug/metabolite transporter (DMT)-like permease
MSTLFFALGMLITGTINTLTRKIQNDTKAKGVDGTIHPFRHPFFQTFVMFIGEALCLIPLFIQRRNQRRRYQELIANSSINTTIGDSQKFGEPRRSRVFSWIFLLPAVCDLLGTSLGGIGLLYTPASVWQMLRGSTIIFSGLLSILFLKRKLYIHHWLGMFIVTSGLAVVGVSNVLRPDSTDANQLTEKLIFGIGFILAGQLIGAIQMIVEEVLLKKRRYPPLNVVGMEGVFGILLMVLVVLPLLYIIPGYDVGSYENCIDALIQMQQSWMLLVFVIAYCLSIAFYNFFGLSVAKRLTTVHRTLIDACRMILVWGTQIAIYYLITTLYGEKWHSFSWVQLIGFGLLVIGTLIYNAVIRMPCSTYPSATQQAKENASIGEKEAKPLLLNMFPESPYVSTSQSYKELEHNGTVSKSSI